MLPENSVSSLKNSITNSSFGVSEDPVKRRPPSMGSGFSGPQAPGLVSLVTSDTGDFITLSPSDARLKKMRKSVMTASRLFTEQTGASGFRYKPAMITLTYAETEDWDPKDISLFLKRVREYLRRRGEKLYYVWVLELQKRGTPHYHILLWLPKGVTLPKPDKRGWWEYGSTRIEWVRRSAVAYIAKYVSKDEELEFLIPKGARIHSNGGLSQERRNELSWWKLPKWVREHFSVEDRAMRRPGGGWISRESGEELEPLYEFVGHSDNWRKLYFVRKNVPVSLKAQLPAFLKQIERSLS